MTAVLRTTALTVLACLLLMLPAVDGARFSSAIYTAQSHNGASTVTAASDWTPPTVSVTSPGIVKGSVTLTATATDAETGIATVAVQVRAVEGGSWTALCTATSAPYRCTWDTTAVTDGQYDLRAVATDNAGNSATSETARFHIGNHFGIILTDPGEVLRGSVTLRAALLNANLLGLYAVRFEYAVAGTDDWKSLLGCLNLLGSADCTSLWLTTTVPSGVYDLRATANPVLNPSNTVSSAVFRDLVIDNTAPIVAMTDPGSPLSGTVTLAASASDAHSGIASVSIQYAVQGTSVWVTACTPTQAPYTCPFSTASLAPGSYAFRAVATDVAGISSTSAVVSNRTVDNTVSTVSMVGAEASRSETAALTVDAECDADLSHADVPGTACSTAPVAETGPAVREF